MRRRIPVVGSSQLHTVQISPEVRRIEARRARRAARRESAPILAADRGAFSQAKRDYRTEASSAKGATNMVEGTLVRALAGLKTSGLSGRYLQQATKEFTSRAADAASGLPFLLAEASENRGKSLRAASSQLAQDKAAMQQNAAQMFDQRLKEMREAGASALKAQSGTEPFDPKKLQNASIALQDSLVNWAKNGEVEVDGKKVPIQTLNPLATIDDWRALAQGLTKQYDGFDLRDAMAAIRRYLAKHLKQGATGPYRSQSSVPAIRSQPERRAYPPPAG